MVNEEWVGSTEWRYVQLLKKREQFLHKIDAEIIKLEQEIFKI